MCLWAGGQDLVFQHIVKSFMIWVDKEIKTFVNFTVKKKNLLVSGRFGSWTLTLQHGDPLCTVAEVEASPEWIEPHLALQLLGAWALQAQWDALIQFWEFTIKTQR